ncbi:MAG: hypothetical protein JSW11_01290 [Candidatus Heimdallarchaeota archaeon]|nr:MAG: hypothetical protein JSW11_01290 [Candidatus Heimdallarchaeota archaeon]
MSSHQWIRKYHLRTRKNANVLILIELVMKPIAQTIFTPQSAEGRMI